MRSSRIPRFHLAVLFSTVLKATVLLATMASSAFAQAEVDDCEWLAVELVRKSDSPYPDRADGLRTKIHVDGARFLKLHFAYVDFEMGFDFLKIYDGAGNPVSKLTGEQLEFDSPVITGDTAYLDIHSDFSKGARGFLVNRVDACLPRTPLRQPPPPATSGQEGPAWAEFPVQVRSQSPYADNLVRSPFDVSKPGAKALKLFFQFIDVEQGYDYVEIFDSAGNLAERHTGAKQGFWSEPLQGDSATIALSSDFMTSGRGFLVTRLSAYLPGVGGTPVPREPTPRPQDPHVPEVNPDDVIPDGVLASLLLLESGPGGEPLPEVPGSRELLIGDNARGRIHVRVLGLDASGRGVPLTGSPSYRVIAPVRSLSCMARADGTFVITAGQEPCENAVVEFFTRDSRGRDVRTALPIRVLDPTPVLSQLALGLGSQTAEQLPDTVVLIASGEALELTVTPLDAEGQLFLPPGLRLRAVTTGEPVLAIADLGDCRFALTPRHLAGEAGVFFTDVAGTVRSRTLRVQVVPPRFHHTDILILRGRNWESVGIDGLILNPVGFGEASCTIEVRGIDETGNVMPPERFHPRVRVTDRQQRVRMEDLGNNRFRIHSQTERGAQGMRLVVLDSEQRIRLGEIPVRVTVPRPELASLQICAVTEGGLADVSGQHITVPARGSARADSFEFEIVPVDQFGRPMAGLEIEPAFSFPDGGRPGQLRRVSRVPSRWELLPISEECGATRMDIGARGYAFGCHVMISIVDKSYVDVGAVRAASWVKWGLKRDYDFQIQGPLRLTTAVRVEASSRMAIKSLWVQLDGHELVQIPGTEASLGAGARRAFEISVPEGKKITMVRVNGYTDPNCRITLSAKRPSVRRSR